MNVDVVIPTFNRAELTIRAIRSVYDQSFPIRNVIVVDDGSTDDTRERIIDQYPEVELIFQENAGVSAARNTGIRAAKSEWIAFLDSDDEWFAQKITRQVAALKQSPEYQVCHTDEIWIRNGKRVNPMDKHAKPHGRIFQQCLPLCCVSPSSILIKTSLLKSAGMFDESLPACEDYDLWLKIFSQTPALLVREKLLIKYGGHDDQLSKKYWGMDRFRVTSLITLLEKNSLNENDRESALAVLRQKLEILITGFEKRKNNAELVYYRNLSAHWNNQKC